MEVWPLKNPSLYKQLLECFKTSKPVNFFFYLSPTWVNMECPFYLQYEMIMTWLPDHTWRRHLWIPYALCLKPMWLCWILRALQTWPYPAALPDFLVLVDLLVWFCRVFLHCPTPILILFPPPYLYINKASPGISIPSYSNPILPYRTSFLREALLVIHPAPLASTGNSLALRVRQVGIARPPFLFLTLYLH